MKKLLFIISMFLLSTILFALNYSDNNRIDADVVYIENTTDNWTKYNKNEINISNEDYFKGKIKWTATLNGPRCSAVSITKENINLPIPERIEFKYFPTDSLMFFIGVEDTTGVVNLYYPKNIKPMQWNNISIKINELLPMGIGGEKINDINKISLIYSENGVCKDSVSYIDKILVFYPFGTYYPHKTKEELLSQIDDLKSKNSLLTNRIKALNEKGYPCRYQLSAITLVNEFCETTKSYIDKNWLRRSEKILNYLDSLIDKTNNEFDEIEKNPENRIDYIEYDVNKMVLKDGVFYAPMLGGDPEKLRPMFLTGICGWFKDEEYSIIKSYGYNATGFEWVLSDTDNPNVQEYMPYKFNYLKRENVAFQILFSPHYMPLENYEKYPDLDPLNMRRPIIISPFNVASEGLRELVGHHMDNCIPKLKDCPNLIGYDLENELYSAPYPDFVANKFETDGYNRGNAGKDITDYTQKNMSDFVTWYRDKILSMDDTHPIFSKLCPGTEVQGYRRENISNILSGHSYWTCSYPQSEDFAGEFFGEGLELDTYNSFDKNKIITEGEYHLNGVEIEGYEISEKYANWCMWNCYVRGKDVSLIWGWGTDGEDFCNMFRCQPWAMHAVGKANMDVSHVAEYVVPFAKAKRDYGVFYGGSGILELYKAMTFSDANFDFITDMTVSKGLDNYKFIIILDDATVSADTMKAINKASIPIVKLSSKNDAKSFWKQMASSKKKYNIVPLISPQKYGVDCRSYKQGNDTIFYLSNYNKESVKITLPKKSTDLLTGKEYLNITLEPMDFYLMKL